jgi:four helix bundle protein
MPASRHHNEWLSLIEVSGPFLSVPVLEEVFPQGLDDGAWGVGRGEAETMALQNYRDLELWQRAMSLAEDCYRVTKEFPKEEMFGLTSQIRRAAVSIPANIAEGQGRQHTKEFVNHLSIARGSLKELETHVILSHGVGFLNGPDLECLLGLTEEVSRMMSGLRKTLERRL